MLGSSAGLVLLRESPSSFFSKATERIRQVNCLPSFLVNWSGSQQRNWKKLNSIELLEATGEWRKSAEAVSKSKSLPRLSELRGAFRNVERSRLANRRIARKPGRTPERPLPKMEIRPLFFLNNSLPHTQSGYTLRTHATLVALQRIGIEVTGMTRLAYPLVVGKLPGGSSEVVDGVEYRRILPFFYPEDLESRFNFTVAAIVEEAKRAKKTVLHTTTDFYNAQIVAEAAVQLGVPWVYECRGELHKTWLSKLPAEFQSRGLESERYRTSERQELNAMLAADSVVAISSVSKQRMVEMGVPPEKISIIPNAVADDLIDRPYEQSRIRAQLQLPEGYLIGTASSLVEYEGLDDLIRAIALTDDLVGVIVGEGVARPLLEKLAADLGVTDRVIFAGRVPSSEVWRWYAAMDLFVIPRKDYEVCRSVTPVKGLMAQALGKPIVASDLPAIREITGGLAVYTEPENSRALLAGIVKAREVFDATRKQSSMNWAREHTWQANATLYRDLYSKIGG